MNCEKCNVKMEDGYKIKLDSAPLASVVLSKKRKFIEVLAFVCPKCGKVELYTSRFNANKSTEDYL